MCKALNWELENLVSTYDELEKRVLRNVHSIMQFNGAQVYLLLICKYATECAQCTSKLPKTSTRGISFYLIRQRALRS